MKIWRTAFIIPVMMVKSLLLCTTTIQSTVAAYSYSSSRSILRTRRRHHYYFCRRSHTIPNHCLGFPSYLPLVAPPLLPQFTVSLLSFSHRNVDVKQYTAANDNSNSDDDNNNSNNNTNTNQRTRRSKRKLIINKIRQIGNQFIQEYEKKKKHHTILSRSKRERRQKRNSFYQTNTKKEEETTSRLFSSSATATLPTTRRKKVNTTTNIIDGITIEVEKPVRRSREQEAETGQQQQRGSDHSSTNNSNSKNTITIVQDPSAVIETLEHTISNGNEPATATIEATAGAHIAEIIMPKTKRKAKVYAVAIGRTIGIYDTWNACQQQVKGYSKATYKSFSNRSEAEQFIARHATTSTATTSSSSTTTTASVSTSTTASEYNEDSASATGFDGTKSKRRRTMDTTTSDKEILSNTVQQYDNDNEEEEEKVQSQQEQQQQPTQLPYKLWFHVMFDGGSRANPNGHAGSGTYITTRKFYNLDTNGISTATKQAKQQVYNDTYHIRSYLGFGKVTNNQAEYNGLVVGLEHIVQQLHEDTTARRRAAAAAAVSGRRDVTIVIQGDSDLIMKQMNGLYKCKSPKLISYHQKSIGLVHTIKNEIDTYSSGSPAAATTTTNSKPTRPYDITFEHVYRESNTVADRLANEAMDGQRSWISTKTLLPKPPRIVSSSAAAAAPTTRPLASKDNQKSNGNDDESNSESDSGLEC